MPYDPGLADRFRSALGQHPAVTEKKMFGGLSFLFRGNMAVGVLNDDLLVRLSPSEGEAALREPHIRPMDFTGRPMKGWIFVGPGATGTPKGLQGWVDRGIKYAGSLPPKD